MKYVIAIVLLALPVAAMADACSKAAAPVTTTPYTKTFKCTVSSIIVKGETNSGERQECPGDVPAAKETAYYTNGSGLRSLPTINSLFSKSDGNLDSKTWIAAKGHCQGDNSIIVDYWAAGGCRGCERSVQYSFNEDGSLQEVHLIAQ